MTIRVRRRGVLAACLFALVSAVGVSGCGKSGGTETPKQFSAPLANLKPLEDKNQTGMNANEK